MVEMTLGQVPGYELETKSNKPVAGNDFGATIPANPDLIDTQAQLKEMFKRFK